MLQHRLAWPVATLVLLLALNAAFNPTFLHIEWRDGHLYGSLIDILNRAAPLVQVALGMTLVIATRGIDISVGAVVAIAAALAIVQVRYLVDPVDLEYHLKHTAALSAWAFVAWALQRLLNRPRWAEAARYLWAVADPLL